MVSAWRNFKKKFPRPLFIIIFRPELLKFHPYSILTGDTMVGCHFLCVKQESVLKIYLYFCALLFKTMAKNHQIKKKTYIKK